MTPSEHQSHSCIQQKANYAPLQSVQRLDSQPSSSNPPSLPQTDTKTKHHRSKPHHRKNKINTLKYDAITSTCSTNKIEIASRTQTECTIHLKKSEKIKLK